MRRKYTRLAAVAAVLTMLLAFAPAALAEPPSQSGAVDRAPALPDYFYWEGDYVVFTGNVDFAEWCQGVGFPDVIGSTVSPGNGTSILHYTVKDIEILVIEVDFSDPNDLFPWLGEQCFNAIVLETPPVSFAEGTGTLSVTSRTDADGIIHDHNGVQGKVTTTSGDEVHLSTFAQLTIGPDGFNLTQLRVNLGG